MITIEEIVVRNTNKLISGLDYREEIVNMINSKFIDFSLYFFKEILDIKIQNQNVNIDWYRKYFMEVQVKK